MGGGLSKGEKEERKKKKHQKRQHLTRGPSQDTIKPPTSNKGSKSKNKMKRLSRVLMRDKEARDDVKGPVRNSMDLGEITQLEKIYDSPRKGSNIATKIVGYIEDGEERRGSLSTVQTTNTTTNTHTNSNSHSRSNSNNSNNSGMSAEEYGHEGSEGSITLDFTENTFKTPYPLHNNEELYVGGYPDAIVRLGDTPRGNIINNNTNAVVSPNSSTYALKRSKDVTPDEENKLNRITSYRPRGRSISDSLFHINPDGTRDVNVMDMQKTIKIEKSKKKIFQEMNALLEEKNVVIDLSELDFVQVVGYGAFSEVWEGYWNGFRVAIKRLRLSGDDARFEERFLREVENLRKGNHPNVVMFFGVCLKPPCIVTEFMAGGNLYNVLHPNSEPGTVLSFPVVMKMATDLAVALLHLHSLSILHRDLTPLNILLDEVGNVKISDFGLSREKAQEGSMTMTMGGICNPRWRPPEITKNKGHYSEKIDVYCFALLVWEMLTSQIPFAELDGSQAAAQVAYANLRPLIPDTCHPQLRDLIQQCWHDDPNQRPDFENIVLQLRSITWKNPMGLLTSSPRVPYSPRFSRVYSAGTPQITVPNPTATTATTPNNSNNRRSGGGSAFFGSPAGSKRNSGAGGAPGGAGSKIFVPIGADENTPPNAFSSPPTSKRNSANSAGAGGGGSSFFGSPPTSKRNSGAGGAPGTPGGSAFFGSPATSKRSSSPSAAFVGSPPTSKRNSGAERGAPGTGASGGSSIFAPVTIVGNRNSISNLSPLVSNRNSTNFSPQVAKRNSLSATAATALFSPQNPRNSIGTHSPGVAKRNSTNFSAAQVGAKRNSTKRASKFILDANGDFVPSPTPTTREPTTNNNNRNSTKLIAEQYSSPTTPTNYNNTTPTNSFLYNSNNFTSPPIVQQYKQQPTPTNSNRNSTKFNNNSPTTDRPTTPTTQLTNNFNTITISNNIVINNNIFINSDTTTTTPNNSPPTTQQQPTKCEMDPTSTPTTQQPVKLV